MIGLVLFTLMVCSLEPLNEAQHTFLLPRRVLPCSHSRTNNLYCAVPASISSQSMDTMQRHVPCSKISIQQKTKNHGVLQGATTSCCDSRHTVHAQLAVWHVQSASSQTASHNWLRRLQCKYSHQLHDSLQAPLQVRASLWPSNACNTLQDCTRACLIRLITEC